MNSYRVKVTKLVQLSGTIDVLANSEDEATVEAERRGLANDVDFREQVIISVDGNVEEEVR